MPVDEAKLQQLLGKMLGEALLLVEAGVVTADDDAHAGPFDQSGCEWADCTAMADAFFRT